MWADERKMVSPTDLLRADVYYHAAKRRGTKLVDISRQYAERSSRGRRTDYTLKVPTNRSAQLHAASASMKDESLDRRR
jgi:hypothetical protein